MMTPLLITALGAGAAICSMGSFAPQVLKIWREKDARGVSLNMYLVTVLGFGLWTAYGGALRSWPLTASNGVCMLLATTVLVLKLRYRGR